MRRVQGKLIGTLLAIACGSLGACHHHFGAGSTASLPGGAGAASSATDPADRGVTDMVAAVSGRGAEDGPVGLKFQLGQRPSAGKPVVITLRLVANQALEHLEARFHPDDALEIRQGADFDPLGHLDAGTAVDHTLTLVPAREGVFTLLATVTTGAAAESVSRSFVIPIVVGTEAGPTSDDSAPSPSP
jgi:hypothetical protein